MTLKQLWIGCTQVEVVPTVFRTTERERESNGKRMRQECSQSPMQRMGQREKKHIKLPHKHARNLKRICVSPLGGICTLLANETLPCAARCFGVQP